MANERNNRLPLGTFAQDGLRSGPLFPAASFREVLDINNNVVDGNQIPFSGGNYTQFGPGVLHSPIFTYTFTPAVPITGNVVATTVPSKAQDLTLTGDWVSDNIPSSSKKYTVPETGLSALQFDYPRGIQISINFGVLEQTAPATITIFGYDWYGNKMQEDVPLQGLSGLDVELFSRKAFFGVTRVYVSGPINAGGLTIETAQGYGLPYRLYGVGDIISIGYGTQNASETALTNDPMMGLLAAPNAPSPVFPNYGNALLEPYLYSPQGFFYTTDADKHFFEVTQDTTIFNVYVSGKAQTSLSRDVRGIWYPDTLLLPYPGTNAFPTTFTITYYVRGADTFLNQMQAIRDNNPNIPKGMPILPNYQVLLAGSDTPQADRLPLNAYGLYGVPQFYTGKGVGEM